MNHHLTTLLGHAQGFLTLVFSSYSNFSPRIQSYYDNARSMKRLDPRSAVVIRCLVEQLLGRTVWSVHTLLWASFHKTASLLSNFFFISNCVLGEHYKISMLIYR